MRLSLALVLAVLFLGSGCIPGGKKTAVSRQDRRPVEGLCRQPGRGDLEVPET